MLRAKPAENTRADCKQDTVSKLLALNRQNLGEIPVSKRAQQQPQPSYCTGGTSFSARKDFGSCFVMMVLLQYKYRGFVCPEQLQNPLEGCSP